VEGGFMIEKMAKLLFPEGKELPVTSDADRAARETMAELAEENVTLFETAFLSAGKLARVNVLIKRGDELEIIEAKAKSYSSSENEAAILDGRPKLFRSKRTGEILGEWREYLEDVTFQVIHARLILSDKSKLTEIERRAPAIPEFPRIELTRN